MFEILYTYNNREAFCLLVFLCLSSSIDHLARERPKRLPLMRELSAKLTEGEKTLDYRCADLIGSLPQSRLCRASPLPEGAFLRRFAQINGAPGALKGSL